jgi:hypothetical protein
VRVEECAKSECDIVMISIEWLYNSIYLICCDYENDMMRNIYIYGFIVVLGIISIAMGVAEDFTQEDYEALMTEEHIEINNIIIFGQFAMMQLPDPTLSIVVQMPPPSRLDNIAIDTLISRGVPNFHARFVCNYLLMNNLPYPGKLCFLTSNTHDKYHCVLPQDFPGIEELFRFNSGNYHEIIAHNYCVVLRNIALP